MKTIYAEKNRIYYLDRLRVTSIFVVMLLHVAAAFWGYTPVAESTFRILTVFNAAAHFCVPTLVMITGALMLAPERDGSIRTVYQKRLPRIVWPLIGWTLIYFFVMVFWRYLSGLRGQELVTYALERLKRPMHLWYLYMLIGLYLIAPILKCIAKDRKLLRYCLLLSLSIAVLTPTVFKLPFFTVRNLPDYSGYLSFVLGYTGYFLLGYYLSTLNITKKAEGLFYALGLIGLLFSILGTIAISEQMGSAYAGFMDYLSLSQCLTAMAVFVLFQKRLSFPPKTERANKILSQLNENSFGMYLVHVLIHEFLISIGLTALRFSPLIAVPLISVLVFIISFVLTALIRRIPWVRRYLT